MPKAKVDRVVNDDGTNKVIEIEAAAGGGTKDTKTAQYTVPASAAKFQEMILSLSATPDGGKFVKSVFGPDRQDQNESPLDFAYRIWCTNIDRMARASVYEQAAQESTFITVGKERINVMTFPVKRLVQAVNRYRQDREMKLEVAGVAPGAENDEINADKVKSVERGMGFGVWRTVARKLVDGYESDGKVVPPQAKENSASGMLEQLAA